MKNLNKFRKDELINKLKDLQINNKKLIDNSPNKSKSIKIVEFIIFFKNWIIRLTLIALLIKWLKNYSLFRKFYHIFSWIASTLFGATLIDVYSLDIINWVKETNIYKWIYDLLNFKEIIEPVKEVKSTKEIKTIKEDSEFRFPKGITNKTNEDQKRHVTLSEWFNRDINKGVIKDDSLFDKIKDNSKNILIISGVVIVSGFSWYYFPEIKNGVGTSIEWIKNYLFGPSSDPSTDSTKGNILDSTQHSKLDFKSKFLQVIARNEQEDKIIKLSDNITKGKDKLTDDDREDMKRLFTSPSLENLNNKAEEAWSDSSSSSSTETITLSNFKPDLSNISEAGPSNIQNSSEAEPSNTSTIISKLLSKIWKLTLDEKTKNNMSFIEDITNSNEDLTNDSTDKLISSLVDIIETYDFQVDLYNKKDIFKWSSNDEKDFKECLFYFKVWINEYTEKLMPLKFKLELDINNKPEKITSWFKSNLN